MRTQFKGHFTETEEKIDELWKKATFVFDSNVLLDLYRYSERSQNDLLKLLVNIKKRVWLPEQVAHEYLNIRASVICAQVTKYSDAEKMLKEIENSFSSAKAHPYVSDINSIELNRLLLKIQKEVAENRDKQEQILTDDPIKKKIEDIFHTRVGISFTEDELANVIADGETRNNDKIPPGYKDNKKGSDSTIPKDKRRRVADFILWRQTMDWATKEKKDIVFVTGDMKEDWWLIESGKTISARPELIAEFCEVTGRSIIFYKPERFIGLAKEKLGLKVTDDTISEIDAQATKNRERHNRMRERHNRMIVEEKKNIQNAAQKLMEIREATIAREKSFRKFGTRLSGRDDIDFENELYDSDRSSRYTRRHLEAVERNEIDSPNQEMDRLSDLELWKKENDFYD